jgi:putative nucleotidyltransferase with HDIG domain
VAVKKSNFRRLLSTVETLADLGPEITAERDFSETATTTLALVIQAVAAREGALFTFTDRPAMLSSVAASGFALFPDTAVIPLLPKHVHALLTAGGPQAVSSKTTDTYLSSNGNVAPELFKCIVPLKVGAKLVGLIALGRREGDAGYEADEFEILGLLSTYVALAVHNHTLLQSLQGRVSENLRLLASLHSFYDHTLQAFATAIDVKDLHLRGHSQRVAHYAAGMGEALGLGEHELVGLRAAGYLHDIGKVTVDKNILGKPSTLDAREFREVIDHTTIGHQIVQGVQFPWPQIPEVVRWHHERADGTGYPDRLHAEELSLQVRILAVADTFDAMTSDRAHRPSFSLGEALSELVRMTPQKYDANIVQAMLVQVRRDAVGRGTTTFLDPHIVCNIGVPDIDHMAATVHHKATGGRHYLT